MKSPNDHDIEASPPSFVQVNQRFKPCCCHILNWAYGIGIFELVSMVVYLGRAIVTSFQDGQFSTESIVEIVTGILWIVVISLFLHGVKKGCPYFVIPHMVIQILYLIGMHMAVIMTFVAGLVVLGGIQMISIAISGFFLYVIIQTYRFLKANEAINNAVAILESEYSTPLVATITTRRTLQEKLKEILRNSQFEKFL